MLSEVTSDILAPRLSDPLRWFCTSAERTLWALGGSVLQIDVTPL